MKLEDLTENNQVEQKAAAGANTGPDTLLDSLLIVCRIHGIAVSKDALVAGLPLHNERLTPSMVERAAVRANLVCNVIKKPLSGIHAEFTPAILLLENEEACV
ncbi:MAG: type I secretion system permease/ATPase, partial [Methylophilaceae bacterium]